MKSRSFSFSCEVGRAYAERGLEQAEDKIMNEICYIKRLFASKSIQKKIDYLDNCNVNINDEIRDFFVRAIKSNQSRNIWYKISLIDFVAKHKIKDVVLLKNFIMDLISPNNYYLKLTILDYICDTYSLYDNEKIEYNLLEKVLYNKHDRYIVKNQIIICLMTISHEKKYWELLKKNLLKTTDYRGHIRIYNTIINYDLIKDSYLLNSDIKELIRITLLYDFSRSISVQDVLQRINNYISE